MTLEEDTVSAQGTVRENDTNNPPYGTHILVDSSGKILYALQSSTVNLPDYDNENVTLSGNTVPPYTNPSLLDVGKVNPENP
ncbi:MAG: hypothetical protein JO202_20345 [Ktedonobacteraceae bacterium]|nr:hypothetical protein [Ktedonobacteraceae bacterium]